MTDINEDFPVRGRGNAAPEALETYLRKFSRGRIIVPDYQRDSDQWDANKKSLLVESVLLGLTIPAHYLAPWEHEDVQEILDGQQRTVTLDDFLNNRFRLAASEKCPYYGSTLHYAGLTFQELAIAWQDRFNEYEITCVRLPSTLDAGAKLETFRRINMVGSPLSPHDIRLGYYTASKRVKFIQLCGVYDLEKTGSKRMLNQADGLSWPWRSNSDAAAEWQDYWHRKKIARGQTASSTFLWFLICKYRKVVYRLLADGNHLKQYLNHVFRNDTEQVLDLFCAQLKYEDSEGGESLFPSLEELQERAFVEFRHWFYQLRLNCQMPSSKHRQLGLLTGALAEVFGDVVPSSSQWELLLAFVDSPSDTAKKVGVVWRQSKGRWAAQKDVIENTVKVVRQIQKR